MYSPEQMLEEAPPLRELEPEIGIAGKKTSTVPKIPRSSRPKVHSFWNTPQEIPVTKITIHHVFDPLLHFVHKVNVTIRSSNAAIRLIFKNTKEQTAITAVSPGSTIH